MPPLRSTQGPAEWHHAAATAETVELEDAFAIVLDACLNNHGPPVLSPEAISAVVKINATVAHEAALLLAVTAYCNEVDRMHSGTTVPRHVEAE